MFNSSFRAFSLTVVTVPYNKAVEQCVTFGSFSSKAAKISYNVICLILIYGAPLLITIVFVILGIVFKFKGKNPFHSMWFYYLPNPRLVIVKCLSF